MYMYVVHGVHVFRAPAVLQLNRQEALGLIPSWVLFLF